MKGIRYAILLVAGFCLGWGAQSLMGIAMRKSANSRFLSESELTLKAARGKVASFKAREKRFPAGVGELVAKGYLDAADMPIESMHREARWVGEWDGPAFAPCHEAVASPRFAKIKKATRRTPSGL